MKKLLIKNKSIFCLSFGVANIMAGLHHFNGGALDTVSIGTGIILCLFFARGF